MCLTFNNKLMTAMPSKRRRSSIIEEHVPPPKRSRTSGPADHLSDLSDELLIRVLHNLPIHTLLQCQRLSHRFYTLAGDSQIWKNLYYQRFVLPRALRIPGMRTARPDDSLLFSSKHSKWLDENTLVNRVDGERTNWKRQYKLRHNWSIGACDLQEIHVADRPSVPSMLVKLAEGLVLTADHEDGLRAWDLKEKVLITQCELGKGLVPTCLAVDELESGGEGRGIAVGFEDGGWGTWKLDLAKKQFSQSYRHPASSNGMLSAVAYANPYVLTITDSQLLSLYTFTPPTTDLETEHSPPDTPQEYLAEAVSSDAPLSPAALESDSDGQPRLLASLKSHTSWPPLSLSIRTTSTTIIASIAYSLPTYFSGYTVGLQELHLSLTTGTITFSRLASALPQGFSSILSNPTSSPSSPGSSSPRPTNSASNSQLGSLTRPTSLSYSHPYILATHPDNTLTLYLCTSTASTLTITTGTKLWGHTSSVSSAEITPRGKAVSVSTRGNELRVWELEGGLGAATSKKRSMAPRLSDRSVRIRPDERDEDGTTEVMKYRDEVEDSKRWVGFDDEVVIVLKERGQGSQALMIYDFT